MRRVLITGLGFATCLGFDRKSVVQRLRQSRHGFALPGWLADLPCFVKVAAPPVGFDVDSTNPLDWTWPDGFGLLPEMIRGWPPHAVYAWCAVQGALNDAGLAGSDLTDGSTGLFAASVGSPRMMRHYLNRMADTDWRRGHPLGIVTAIPGSLHFHLGSLLQIRGAACTFVSACTSSGHALGAAFDEISSGRQERVLVVGAEELNRESLLPFSAMDALSRSASPDAASRPFDRKRDGFVGTGGAAALVLESEAAAQHRGAPAQAEFLAWAQASDGFHVAQPPADGNGILRAMQQCLKSAGVTAETIDAVNVHATSTPAGDAAEAAALLEAFPPERCQPAIVATKSLTGHGLSMAGAMEAAFCVLSLTENFLPGHPSLRDPDPCIGNLRVLRESTAATPQLILNNGSGFGGTNVCQIFRRAEPSSSHE